MAPKSSGTLRRREVVSTLLSDRGELLVIAGLGAPAWDITAAGDHPRNLPLWGGMGSAATIGLGLALAQPSLPVLVITGDGEMLMGIGALATIAVARPPNLSVVVLDNEHYGETGMQPTHTGAGVNLAGMAGAAGIPRVFSIRGAEEVAPLRRAIHEKSGPLFAQIKIDAETLKLVLPPREGALLQARMRESILGPEAHLA
ncbi:thiamine pyrophosphate-dependent enzyme [Roseomonas sp. E05]|uniref:thiamine pyrophosphate-dependent enzyme n=1 Tax=Roseomonas sp. E05 TaxID=3046310 RepID=UPI0024BBB3B2|nr:thiamine pyrophosphate-dependent enzyme [Roseomonas sp. E05]MDJ0391336.1 thiamine pyrophosphate-dependent enzyme [Roseomonas sp. E05]